MSLVPVPTPTVSTAVALAPVQANAWVDLVEPAAELANRIADTDFVPKAFRKSPAAVAACILYGAEIGLGPMQSLAKVDVVEGRPAPKAELARALLLSAGHDMWIEEMTNTKVTVAGKRRGSDVVQRVTWTMDDAKKAGLASKQMYAKYPRQMLAARASAELARLVAPDALGGIAYFAEELDDDTFSEPATAVAAEAKPGTTKRRRATPEPETPAAPAPAASVEPDLPPLPGDDEPAAMTDAQKKKLHALLGNLDVQDRDDRLALCTSIVGRPLASSADLTKDEASRVIDALTQVEAGDAELVYDDGRLRISAPEDATGDELELQEPS